jgi:hypothetical protein
MTKRSLASPSRVALISAILGGALGCIASTGGGGAGGGSGTDTAYGFTQTGTVANCREAVVSCSVDLGSCDCRGNCPLWTMEARCTSPDGGLYQCECFLNGSPAGTCAENPGFDFYPACRLDVGCCASFFPVEQ